MRPTKIRSALIVLAAVSVAAGLIIPAVAGAKGKPDHAGRGKGKGVVVSYDSTTRLLTVDTHKGQVAAPVAEGAKITVVQRGEGDRKSGNSPGTEADLVAGAVVQAKQRDGEFVRVKVFLPKVKPECDTPEVEVTPLPEETPADVPPAARVTDEPEGSETEDEGSEEEGDDADECEGDDADVEEGEEGGTEGEGGEGEVVPDPTETPAEEPPAA